MHKNITIDAHNMDIKYSLKKTCHFKNDLRQSFNKKMLPFLLCLVKTNLI